MSRAPGRALDIQGHRGARGLAPENTLPGFARALAIGVSTLEMDCGVTRDGVVVVSHGRRLHPDLARTPEGRWLEALGPPIWRLRYAELARYDVGRLRPGSACAARFPEQQPVDGARIPRLAEVFALVERSGNAAVCFNIETKISPLAPEETTTPEDFARRLVRAVREAGVERRTTVQSFDWRTLALVQSEAPEIATACLTSVSGPLDNVQPGRPASAWTAGLHVSRFGGSLPRMVKAAGGAVWSPYAGDLGREALAEAQALGLKVVVWTVNEPAEMRRFIEWGVDGIISDRPDRLREVAGRMGVTLPAPTPVAL